MAATAPATVAVAAVSDLPPGAMLTVTVQGQPVVVANLDGDLVAVDGQCPHAAGPLGKGAIVDGCLLRCPWHGSRFNLRAGTVEAGPARKPAPAHDVWVDAGQILLTLR